MTNIAGLSIHARIVISCEMCNKEDLSKLEVDKFLFFLFTIEDKIPLSTITYSGSCKLVLSSYLDRFSFSIRANNAALNSFP
jgi:hypothetical protein